MTERDEDDLRSQMASLRTSVNIMDGHLRNLTIKVDHLVTAEAMRRGREEVKAQGEEYRHDDRWQVWLRAFLPIGLLTGAFSAFWAWITSIWNGQ